jgi:hypothetical protein
MRTFFYIIFIFFTVSLLINHNSNLCDHNNKINVLQQYAVPPMLLKFSGTKAKYSLVILESMGQPFTTDVCKI